MSVPGVFDLTGRVAVVTGGGTGIGRAIAELLAARGADVVIASRKAEVIEPVAKALAQASGRRCVALAADVTDEEQVDSTIAAAVERMGRLDILVNNSGGGLHHPLRTMPASAWRRDLALNLEAAFLCSQAAYQHLAASGAGAIVNVSSVAGMHGTKGVAAYSAAKSGLQMLTRVAAAEWGGKGIRVNAVACGMVATEKARANWARSGFDGDGAAKVFPLGRPGRPDEIAQAVGFLASDAASYVTGETLSVAGGPQLGGMIETD